MLPTGKKVFYGFYRKTMENIHIKIFKNFLNTSMGVKKCFMDMI